MSNFDNIQAEAKSLFLGFIINNDFLAGNYVYNHQYTRAIFQMHFVATKIYNMINTTEIKNLYEKLSKWLNNINEPTEKDILAAYKELSEILNNHFYSEFHLGLVQTSSLPTQTNTPEHSAIDPNQTSRL
jgi:hypothetical protein